MIPRGPDPTADGPGDDWEGAPEGPEGGATGDDGIDDVAPLGWLPPEDRLWRHPSELSTLTSANGDPDRARRRPGGPGSAGAAAGTIHAVSGRRRTTAIALVGTGAAAAVFAGIVLLNSVGSGEGGEPPGAGGAPSTSVVLTTAPSGSTVPLAAQGAERGLVSLRVTTSGGARAGGGIAVASGGLVATTADVVVGATGVAATSVSGKALRATVVAVDRTADVALLRVDSDLPVPRFVDDATIGTRRQAMVVAITPSSGSGAPAVAWGTATIESVGTVVPVGTTHVMAAIGAMTAGLNPVPGEVLVRPDGGVIGMLQGPRTATAGKGNGTSGFVPADLLVGVAGDLARWGQVRHGWLGVTARDAPAVAGSTGPSGALVVQVDPHGASTGLLRRGDVIDSVDGAPVRSMAELSQRLYVCTAGETVRVGVRRGGTTVDVEVDLGSSP